LGRKPEMLRVWASGGMEIMMKKIFFVTLFFVLWFSWADEQNDTLQAFKLLSPTEQLEKIFTETKYLGIVNIYSESPRNLNVCSY
jgi:hypothetical protein